MGLLDGLIGGAVGAEMVTVCNGLIAKHGGLGGVVEQFRTQGLGNTIKSWVGTGENLPMTADQVHQVFGSQTIAELAAKAGMTPEELSTKLSAILPGMVDKLTPTGVVPAA